MRFAIRILFFAALLGLALDLAAQQAPAGRSTRRTSDPASTEPLPAFTTELTTTVDYIFVVDVSASMVGQPAGSGSAVIFPQVRAAIGSFIRQLQPGSTVTLVPFADGVRPGRRFEIHYPGDREAAISYLNTLQPDGRSTHVYRAIQTAFDDYSAFRASSTDRVAIFLVYTDGRDTEGKAMRDVVERFRLTRQVDDWLYYATLGVELSAEDRKALEESGFSTYVASPRGEVSPIWIVEPRYPLINFGNLLRNPDSARIQSFSVSGTGPFPADVRLRATTDFGPLGTQQGVNVEVEPGHFRPLERVALKLNLVNAQEMPQGTYTGVMQITSNNRSVLVRPSRMRVQFTFATPRLVQIVPPHGSSLDDVRLGRLPSPRDRGRRDTTVATFSLRPNTEAVRHGGRFYVRAEADARNPAALPPGALLINGRPTLLDSIDIAATRELVLGISARAPQVKPGRYRGKLVLADGTVEVEGPHEIAWQLDVKRPPFPLWAYALIVAVLACAAALAWKATRPVLRGRLVIQAPTDQLFREVVLSGRREVRLDAGAYLTAAEPVQIRIVAEGVGRRARPRVYKVVGDVAVRRAGEVHDEAFHSAVLQEGDELRWDRYRLSYHQN